MQWGDNTKIRTHRLAEAEAGFPLLRATPSTAAIRLVAWLDTLSAADRIAFATQLSDYCDAISRDTTLTTEGRAALLRTLPLVDDYFGGIMGLRPPVAARVDLRFTPVKLLAAIVKDKAGGGLDGFLAIAALSDHPAARAPSAAFAASIAEAVPLAPAKLRKRLDVSLSERSGASAERIHSDHTRYTAKVRGGAAHIDLLFATTGEMRGQFSYSISLMIEGRPKLPMLSYEGIWLTPSQWDYVTESNAERSISHFIRIIETCMDLA